MEDATTLPHTISFAVLYRARIDSFGELPKDKRPPRALWDKPYRLNKFLEEVFKSNDNANEKETKFIDLDEEDVE